MDQQYQRHHHPQRHPHGHRPYNSQSPRLNFIDSAGRSTNSLDLIDDELSLRKRGLPIDEYCDDNNYYFWEYAEESSSALNGKDSSISASHSRSHAISGPPLSALDYLRAVRYVYIGSFYSCHQPKTCTNRREADACPHVMVATTIPQRKSDNDKSASVSSSISDLQAGRDIRALYFGKHGKERPPDLPYILRVEFFMNHVT